MHHVNLALEPAPVVWGPYYDVFKLQFILLIFHFHHHVRTENDEVKKRDWKLMEFFSYSSILF